MPLEFEDRPAIGDDYAGEFTWRSLALKLVVASGILAALCAVIGGWVFLPGVWLNVSQKLTKAALPHAAIPTEHWNRIPDIWSLRIVGDDAVTFSSEQMSLHHLLADGGELLHTVYMNSKTGEIVQAPLPGPRHGRLQDDRTTDAGKYINAPEDDALHLTIKAGESCLVGGINVSAEYKLLSIHNGVCVFEQSSSDNRGRKSNSIVTIAPYPASD